MALGEWFIPPEDPNRKIWRYMDFTKFVAMLAKNELFFSRSDKLGDPFEGALPPEYKTLLRQQSVDLWQHELNPTTDSDKAKRDAEAENMSKQQLMILEQRRRGVFISCWHMNEFESAAMWKLYTESNNSIAIRSTYNRLVDCLNSAPPTKGYPVPGGFSIEPTKPQIGVVKYINYAPPATFPPDNLLYPYLPKFGPK